MKTKKKKQKKQKQKTNTWILLPDQKMEYNHGEQGIMSNFILDNVSRESCTEPPVDALNQVD